jgi:carbamoyltransferase
MRILGISHDVLICSAALVEDGEVVAAAAEERFDRQKQSRGFPQRALAWCLESAGIEVSDVDEIAIAWNPMIDAETLPAGWLGARRHRGEHLVQVPAQLMRAARSSASPLTTIEHAFVGAPPITFVSHYDAHLGNSYFLTGWDEAAVAVLDGRAERQTSLIGAARGVKVERLAEVAFPHSLGLFYGAVTQFLGFRPDADEWKVMALAAYGDPERFGDDVGRLVRVAGDGTFSLALEHFEFFNHFDPRMYSDRFVEAFGEPRSPDGDLTDRDRDLAAACQRVFETATAEILSRLHERTGLSRLAVSGGCFMNSVFNGKITDLTPFDEVFVSSCPDDSGT